MGSAPGQALGPPPFGNAQPGTAMGPPPLGNEGRLSPTLRQARDLTTMAEHASDPERFDKALALVQQALKENPSDATAMVVMGDLHMQQMHAQINASQIASTPPEARAWYEKALQADSNNVEALRGLSTYHEFTREPELSLQYDQRLLKIRPGRVESMLHMGRNLKDLGRFDAAAEVLEQARQRWHVLEGEAPDAEAYREFSLSELLGIHEQLGVLLTKQGRVEEAERILVEAVELAEERRAQQGSTGAIVACPYVALGELYRAEGRDAEGAEMYTKAADLEPHKSFLQLDAARKLETAGDSQRAMLYVDRALALSRDPAAVQFKAELERRGVKGGLPPDALFDAALRAFDRYDIQEAGGLVQRAQAARSLPEQDILQAFVLVMQRDYDGARATATGSGQRDARDPGVAAVLTHLAIADKDYPTAEQALSGCLWYAERVLASSTSAANSTHLQGYERLVVRMSFLGAGWIAANQSEHAAAIQHFDRVLSFKPSDVFALLGRANSENALGRLDEAERLLQRVLEIDSDNQYALAELALVRFNQGDDAGAEATFQKALAVESETYTCPYEGLGLVYLRQGDKQKAAQAFEQAIRINPDIEFKKFNGLARIYIEQGRLDEAEQLLLKSIENYPYDDEASGLLAQLRASERE